MDFLAGVFDFLINRPLLMMVVMSLPLLGVQYWKKCFPTKWLLISALLPLAVSLLVIWLPQAVPVILLTALALTIVALVDLLTLVKEQEFTASRELLKVASLGKKHDCLITIANHSNKGCNTEICDDLPNEFIPDVEKYNHHFPPRSKSSFQYQFTSQERGRFTLNRVYMKVASRFGLWHAYYSIEVSDEVFVYPDMKQISQYALLAKTNRLNLLGVRRSRKIGQDNEFERLRDYSQDDNYKHIDWRTTARRRKLTVKDFQANQSQRIIFMVDCGRMMTGESKGIDLLDHALNATLMLSYVALRQGDSVGMICFSDRIHNYTPPRSGVNHINRLLHVTFDQHPRFVESRYDEAFYYLRKHCLKRSLVVLITNVIDEINAGQIHQYLSNLTSRHLPMGVLLRDHQMFDTIDQYIERPTPDIDSRFYSAAVAANIVNWRHQVVTDLQHQGVMALDVFPEKLTANLVNSYLEIKAKHLL